MAVAVYKTQQFKNDLQNGNVESYLDLMEPHHFASYLILPVLYGDVSLDFFKNVLQKVQQKNSLNKIIKCDSYFSIRKPTLLTYACEYRVSEVIELLLQCGAHPNVKDGIGLTPVQSYILGHAKLYNCTNWIKYMECDLIMLKSFKADMKLGNLFEKYTDNRIDNDYLNYQEQLINIYIKNGW